MTLLALLGAIAELVIGVIADLGIDEVAELVGELVGRLATPPPATREPPAAPGAPEEPR